MTTFGLPATPIGPCNESFSTLFSALGVTAMVRMLALKLKNQLAGDIAQLKELLAKQSSRSTKQKFDYDNLF